MPSNPLWMREVRRLFEAAYGESAEPLVVTIKSNGRILRLTVPDDGTPKLSDAQSALLEAARKSGQVLTAKKLAGLAGYVYNSHTRKAVAALTHSGLLMRTPEGLQAR